MPTNAEIIKNNYDWTMTDPRRIIFEEILHETNQEVLKDLVSHKLIIFRINANPLDLRLALLPKIDSLNSLIDIARITNNKDIHKEAMGMILRHIDNIDAPTWNSMGIEKQKWIIHQNKTREGANKILKFIEANIRKNFDYSDIMAAIEKTDSKNSDTSEVLKKYIKSSISNSDSNRSDYIQTNLSRDHFCTGNGDFLLTTRADEIRHDNQDNIIEKIHQNIYQDIYQDNIVNLINTIPDEPSENLNTKVQLTGILADTRLLAKIAIGSYHHKIRAKATKKLADTITNFDDFGINQDNIINLFNTIPDEPSENLNTKIQLTSILADTSLLVKIAVGSYHHEIQTKAALKLAKTVRICDNIEISQDTIARLINTIPDESSENLNAISALIENLDDENLQEQIDSITNKCLLAKIAASNRHYKIRAKAAIKLASTTPNFENFGMTQECILEIIEVTPYTSNDHLATKTSLINILADKGLLTLIDSLANETLLAEIAASNRHYEIRTKAAIKLASITPNFENFGMSQELILELIDNIPDTQAYYLTSKSTLVNILTNENLLAKIPVGNYCPTSKTLALKKISEEKILAEIAEKSTDDDVKNHIIGRIHDEPLLGSIVTSKNFTRNSRIKALRKIRNQEILREISLYSETDAEILDRAIKQMTDETLLTIAMDSAIIDRQTRIKATGKIQAEQLLSQIINASNDPYIKLEAIKNQRDNHGTNCNTQLLEIYARSSVQDIKLRAIDMLPQENDVSSELESIALDMSAENKLRIKAVQRIKNPNILIRIFDRADDYSTKLASIKMLPSTNNFENTLKSIIIDNAIPLTIRIEAIQKIANNDILAEIFTISEDVMIRNASLFQLANKLIDDIPAFSSNITGTAQIKELIDKIIDLKIIEPFQGKHQAIHSLSNNPIMNFVEPATKTQISAGVLHFWPHRELIEKLSINTKALLLESISCSNHPDRQQCTNKYREHKSILELLSRITKQEVIDYASGKSSELIGCFTQAANAHPDAAYDIVACTICETPSPSESIASKLEGKSVELLELLEILPDQSLERTHQEKAIEYLCKIFNTELLAEAEIFTLSNTRNTDIIQYFSEHGRNDDIKEAAHKRISDLRSNSNKYKLQQELQIIENKVVTKGQLTQEEIATVIKCSNNNEIRSAAILAIEDENWLNEISKTESNSNTRLLAAERLSQILAAKRLSHILAAERSLDAIMTFLDNEESIENKLKLLDSINDENILSEVAKSKSQEIPVQQAACIKLNDENILEQIATSDTSSSTKIIAISRISHQETIKRIAQASTDVEIKEYAIAKISDEAAIAEFAINSFDQRIADFAGEIVKSPVLIEKIAISSNSTTTSKFAVAKLSGHPYALARIARSARRPDTRNLALKSVSATPTLFAIANNDPDNQLRKTAINKLQSPIHLFEIANTTSNDDIQALAIQRLNKITNARILLFAITKNDKLSLSTRLLALNNISDTTTLALLSECDQDEIRSAALKKLLDIEHPNDPVIIELAIHSNNTAFAKECLERITEETALTEFIVNCDSDAVKVAATNRLKKLNLMRGHENRNLSEYQRQEDNLEHIRAELAPHHAIEKQQNIDAQWFVCPHNNDTGSLRVGVNGMHIQVGDKIHVRGEPKPRTVSYLAGSSDTRTIYCSGFGEFGIGEIHWMRANSLTPIPIARRIKNQF